MRSSWPLVAIVVSGVACGFSPSTISDAGSDPTVDGGLDASVLPDCRAQRLVHVVGGVGSLAWFTLVWPTPEVIENFQEAYAYDDPARARSVGGDKPLYARTQNVFGSGPVFAGVGVAPNPSAFAVGFNETHTRTPSSAITLPSGNAIGHTAAVQVERLSPTVPVVVFDPAGYFPITGGPAGLRVTSVDDAITAIRAAVGLTAEQEAELRPSDATLSNWHSATADARVVEFAEKMLFAANLMKTGRSGTVVVDGFNDDPHGAFADAEETSATTNLANELTNVLEGFYRELDTAVEENCSAAGVPLSLADNVMLVVSGDTPKNSFNRSGWPDGTPEGVNFLYVRSNGWLIPGWFGRLTQAGYTSFDPQTGETSLSGTPTGDLGAALTGLLYAATRGDQSYVESIDDSPFTGVRNTP